MPPREPVVLNVAEKPSVARALAQVFSRANGSIDRGMSRANGNIQIFRAEHVCFPSVFSQGHGVHVNGPGKSAVVFSKRNYRYIKSTGNG